MNSDTDSYMPNLPTEVLLFIFSFLPAKDLTLCRRVCVRFKQIIDSLSENNTLWEDFCKSDFENLYAIAHYKARPGVQWCDLYRSLALWPKLTHAREERKEFAVATCADEEILNFHVLSEGIIGVYKKKSIVYYDIETMDKSERSHINGEFLGYTETDDFIVIQGYRKYIYVFRKDVQYPSYETSFSHDSVTAFILLDTEIYYFTMRQELYFCDLEEEYLRPHIITHLYEKVICFGYTNQVNFLTLDRNIYTLYNKNLVHICRLEPGMNLLQMLRKYNLLERMDWQLYVQWMYVLNHAILEGLWRDISAIRTYGDITFVGSNFGTLNVYYTPQKNPEYDLLNLEPMKKYDFVEYCNCAMMSVCPILQIEVLESVNGHMVLVGMQRKVVVLDFNHSYENLDKPEKFDKPEKSASDTDE